MEKAFVFTWNEKPDLIFFDYCVAIVAPDVTTARTHLADWLKTHRNDRWGVSNDEVVRRAPVREKTLDVGVLASHKVMYRS